MTARCVDSAVRKRWHMLLRQHSQSGPSIAQFCNQQGFSTAAFYLWRRRLAGQPAVQAPTAFPWQTPVGPLPRSPHLGGDHRDPGFAGRRVDATCRSPRTPHGGQPIVIPLPTHADIFLSGRHGEKLLRAGRDRAFRAGLALWSKRLESGTFERISHEGAAWVQLDATQLGGSSIESAKRRKRYSTRC